MRDGTVIAVASGKGGTAKTTVAVNLALAISGGTGCNSSTATWRSRMLTSS